LSASFFQFPFFSFRFSAFVVCFLFSVSFFQLSLFSICCLLPLSSFRFSAFAFQHLLSASFFQFLFLFLFFLFFNFSFLKFFVAVNDFILHLLFGFVSTVHVFSNIILNYNENDLPLCRWIAGFICYLFFGLEAIT